MTPYVERENKLPNCNYFYFSHSSEIQVHYFLRHLLCAMQASLLFTSLHVHVSTCKRFAKNCSVLTRRIFSCLKRTNDMNLSLPNTKNKYLRILDAIYYLLYCSLRITFNQFKLNTYDILKALLLIVANISKHNRIFKYQGAFIKCCVFKR